MTTEDHDPADDVSAEVPESSSEVVEAAFDGELEDQPPEVKRAVRIMAERHRGPLPSPEAFAKYDEVLPGAADRIMKLTEKQLDHRVNVESSEAETNKEVARAEITLAKRAQIFTFILTVLFFGVTVYALAIGQPLAAAIGGLATLGTIAYALRGGKDPGVNESDTDGQQ